MITRKKMKSSRKKMKSLKTKNKKIVSSTRKKRHQRIKMKGGAWKPPSLKKQASSFSKLSGIDLSGQREQIKKKFLDITLGKQTPAIREKIEKIIDTDDRLREINYKIDLFVERVETLVQDIIQSSITTSIKVVTSMIPLVSTMGAFMTSSVNWAVVLLKFRYNVLDLYGVYEDMQKVIETEGGKRIDVGEQIKEQIGILHNNSIEKIANDTIKNSGKQIENVSGKMISQIQKKANELENFDGKTISEKTISQLQKKANELENFAGNTISGKTISQLQKKANELENFAGNTISGKTISQLQKKANELQNFDGKTISEKTISQLQKKANEVKSNVKDEVMKKLTPTNIGIGINKLASVGKNLEQLSKHTKQ